MNMRTILYASLILTILFFVILGNSIRGNCATATIKITYEYDSRAICVSARATIDDILVGKAYLEDLVKGKYYLVREVHYSPQTGSEIYVGISKFSIGGGFKIEENRISGQKVMEIFRTWP
jgi:hypothetical protein